jgi:hypothetical protein
VVLLWVVVVYLLASLADLLDNEEVAFGLDDPLDLWLFMSRDDDEVVALLNDGRVAGRRDLDGLDTGAGAALAVEGQGIGDVVLLCTLFDPFVDVAEDLFVACRSFSEVHCRDPLSLRLVAQPPAQSAAYLPQERRALLQVDFTPHSLSPLTTGAPLVGNVEACLASIDAAPPVGLQAPLVVLLGRAESDGQKHFYLG